MVDYKILLDPVFSLPITYSEGTCEDAIDKRLLDYHDYLVTNHIDSPILHESINKFRSLIKEMFKEYYLGHQHNAFEYFKSAFEYESKNGPLPVKTIIPKEPLYRARVNKTNKDYAKDEMFHIKYDLRSRVKPQRFSFPGLPCLYLGASSYVCWAELNRPQMEQFQVAEIQQKDPSQDYEVIDLCIHPLAFYTDKTIKAESAREYNDLSLKDYLRWWPIMAVCSIAVKNEDDPFKPEYVIPQYVLQYFLEDTTDKSIGIKYMSIKVGQISKKQYESDYRTYANYVIPITSSVADDKGFCSVLSNRFEIKRNISGKEHYLINNIVTENRIEYFDGGNDEAEKKASQPLDLATIYTNSDYELQYSKTPFRKIEKILSGDILKDLESSEERIFFEAISNNNIEDLFLPKP